MRLSTKLILAFFLLAVLPLTWIILYSYNSSISAFRKAVESESGALAEEMGGRMDSVRRELAFRVERLGRFPFQKLLAIQGEKAGPQSGPLMADLMAEIGDAAPFVDAIEFSAAPGEPQMPGRPRPPRPPPPMGAASSFGTGAPGPRDLVIHLSQEPPIPAADSLAGKLAEIKDALVMHIRPTPPPPLLKNGRKPPTVEDKQKVEAQLKRIQEFQVFLEKLDAGTDRRRIPGSSNALAGAKKEAAIRAAKMQRMDPLASDFGSEVLADGARVGTVRARVSTPQVFQSVLSRGRRRQGEIPFIIDANNKLHTVSQLDQKKLEALDLPATFAGGGTQITSPQLKDWVVVTRKDESSKLAFGIARPISEPLREIRNTAARNLGYGLGMIGLALVGVVFLSGRITRNLAALSHGAEELAHGNLNARVHVRSRDEIGRLAESFNRMAHDLSENQKHLVEQERLRKELEMSRRIQEELLPKQALQSGQIEVKGVSIPAREVGGDFFNYFPLPGGEVAILVGDVSGKGVAAALLMANLQATLQARLPLVPNLENLAGQLDQEISSSTPREVFLALFMGILNPRENELRYVNAGHNPQFALHATGNIERLASTGRPLGLLPGGGYSERRIKLGTGDGLFLYTDGLIEAEDNGGREFGQQRLEDLLFKARTKSIDEILAVVEAAIRQHRGDVEAADDATMLALKFGA